jgi:hypothetical protein
MMNKYTNELSNIMDIINKELTFLLEQLDVVKNSMKDMVSIYVYVYAYTYTHIYVCINKYTNTYMYICIFVQMSILIYTSI